MVCVQILMVMLFQNPTLAHYSPWTECVPGKHQGPLIVAQYKQFQCHPSRMKDPYSCWWPDWPDFYDQTGCDSSRSLISISEIAGASTSQWQLPCAWLTCLLNDCHLKWQHWLGAIEVAGADTSCWLLQINCPLLWGFMGGRGAEVWPKMLKAVMTLKHHESVSAILAPDPLLFFDVMEVEKVPALASKWTWTPIHDKWEIWPWKTREFNVRLRVHCRTVKAYTFVWASILSMYEGIS